MSSARLHSLIPLRPSLYSLQPLFLSPLSLRLNEAGSQRRRSPPPRIAAAAGWWTSNSSSFSSLRLLASPLLCSQSGEGQAAKHVGDVEDGNGQEEKNGDRTMASFSSKEYLLLAIASSPHFPTPFLTRYGRPSSTSQSREDSAVVEITACFGHQHKLDINPLIGATIPSQGECGSELLKRLRRYGIAGVLSYGLLNTIYYLTTFLSVWFYFAPAPGRMGYAAAAERFLKIMAMVWAGSQVTKIIRAAGALALAPFVARGLSWFTAEFKFESEGKAFAAIAGLCFSVALVLFFGLTLLWA